METAKSTLLDRIENVKETTLSKNAFWLVVIWVFSPMVIMLLNLMNTDSVLIYTVWIYIVDILGGLGLANGLVYIEHLITKGKGTPTEKVQSLLPLIILTLFLFWSLISCLLAEDKHMAFYGRMPMYDCWSIYFLYGGFILSGLILANNKDKTLVLVKCLIAVALFQAVISLMDNSVTDCLCIISPFTNCFHYQSVFYNTNHYGYYILITSLVTGFSFIYSKNIYEKLFLIIVFALFIHLLILNNTLGAYLALLFSLLFVIVWKFLNKEPKKLTSAILLAVFILVTVITAKTSDNTVNSFLGMFTDLNALMNNENLDSVGSGRGELWKNAILCIREQPIFGCGFQNDGAYPLEILTLPHNIFLQMAKYTGIPGAIIYISVFVVGAIRLMRKRKVISPITKSAAFIIVGYLMSAFFGVSKFYTSPYFLIIFGICLKECLNEIAELEVIE